MPFGVFVLDQELSDMKTVNALAAFLLFATTASGAFAQTLGHTNVHTQYMKDDPLVCSKSLQIPGADGSTAMAELPEAVLLYNYRHVTGPNPVIERARALGAIRCYSDLDKSGYMIGLRGAFEAMGGTVTVSRDGKTISVAEPGVSLKLFVGKPSIILNGEERPLDVPPMIARGIIYVPIRVISESLGGYVVWDGIAHSVVIRYRPSTYSGPPPTQPPTPEPSPSEIPTLAPTATPSSTPTPAPAKRATSEHFLAGDYLFAPKTYNAFNAGNTGSAGGSYAARAAVELALGSLPAMLGADVRDFAYPHQAAAIGAVTPPYTACPADGYPGCVSVPGQTSSVYVAQQALRDSTIAGNVGLGILSHTFVAASYIAAFNDFPSSYPSVPRLGGFGGGLDRLPDLSEPFSLYGSVYYYPSVSGTYGAPSGLPAPSSSGTIAESILKYQVGATFGLGSSGIFLDAGYLGDSIRGKTLSNGDASHDAGYAGLGFHF
jgi:hypothetical protein